MLNEAFDSEVRLLGRQEESGYVPALWSGHRIRISKSPGVNEESD